MQCLGIPYRPREKNVADRLFCLLGAVYRGKSNRQFISRESQSRPGNCGLSSQNKHRKSPSGEPMLMQLTTGHRYPAFPSTGPLVPVMHVHGFGSDDTSAIDFDLADSWACPGGPDQLQLSQIRQAHSLFAPSIVFTWDVSVSSS